MEAAMPVAAPMMHDVSPASLDASQQHVLAAWAVSRAMIWEHVAREPRPLFYVDSERFALRATSSIPASTGVWLARSGGSTQVGAWVSDYTIPVRCHVTTILYGRLLVQVFSGRPTASDPPNMVVTAKPGPWRGLMTPIWPVQGAEFWPLALSADIDVPVTEVHERFDRHPPGEMIRL